MVLVLNLHKIIILFFPDAVIELSVMNFINEHREGDVLIFFVDILSHNGMDSNPINYEITLTGLTAGEHCSIRCALYNCNV